METNQTACLFCKIIAGNIEAERIYEDEAMLAFLDHRPVFPGHVLLVPKTHYETLMDLPRELAQPLILATQKIAAAMERGLDAQGSFVAVNNRISQSVPHLHTHIVPRRKGDGLKGFFWPRHPYKSDEERKTFGEKLRLALQR